MNEPGKTQEYLCHLLPQHNLSARNFLNYAGHGFCHGLPNSVDFCDVITYNSNRKISPKLRLH